MTSKVWTISDFKQRGLHEITRSRAADANTELKEKPMLDNEIMTMLSRWDRQQEGYIEQREARFNVMFDILDTAFDGAFTVVDAACGPGSLSKRLLERFPKAMVIAVDADVMLLELATFALSEHSERVRIVEADLSHPSWCERVSNAVGSMDARAPAALVSTTALHWFKPPGLAQFYREVGQLLGSGGIFMNGDHLRLDGDWPFLTGVAARLRRRAEGEALANGEDDWYRWWDRAGSIPRLAALKKRRDNYFAAKETQGLKGEHCSAEFHIAALKSAGFSEAGTAWQHFDNYVVFGRRPQ